MSMQVGTSQIINWKYLPEGEVTGNCVSTSSFDDARVCYGLEYTPGVTGLLTSYTMSFFIECIENYDMPITAKSTLLSDNTQLFDVCDTDGIIFMQASGQDQAPFDPIQVVQNEPIILHQVCMDFSFLDTVDIQLDNFTGVSMSIDGPNGPVTDFPPFDDIAVDYGGFDLRPCSNNVVCDVALDTDNNDIIFDSLANGKIIISSQFEVENSSFKSFDVFDEVNKFCGIPGGQNDLSIEVKAINTYDVYGNGILNEFTGVDLNVEQDTNGVTAQIAFGTNANSQSSVGDVRGYEMTIRYEDHLKIEAEQVNVLLRNPNSSNSVFESTSITFLGPEGLPYGKATYNGYYENGPDLTGSCVSSGLGSPYAITGNGVVVLADQSKVDASQPCNPVNGNMGVDSLVVKAVEDGSLHPNDIVTGFIVRVLGEDIALPSSLDDGSSTNGEDNIAGNQQTNTNTNVSTSVIGFGFDGCVFREPTRQELDIHYTASPEFVSIGDTIRYNIDIYNRTVRNLDSIDIEINLPTEIINIIPSAGLIVDGSVVNFDSLPLSRLDSASMYIRGVIAPSAESTDEIIDIVDGITYFKDSTEHHSFDGWNVSSTQPRSGVVHWEVQSDTAVTVKYLYLEQNVIPTDSTELSFYHKYDTELHKDGGRLELSMDNGNSWFGVDTLFTQNGYSDYINSDTTLHGFSGQQINYTESIINLESFKDQSILIRFSFYNDCESKVDGWFIDDISISNLKNGLNSNALAEMDTLSDMDNIYPVTQVVSCTDVYSLEDSGEGTLRRAISCANPVDEIFFMPAVHDKVVLLDSSIDITKDITIKTKDNGVVISQQGNSNLFSVGNQGILTLEDVMLLHPGQLNFNTIINNNILNLKNATIDGKSGSAGVHIQNSGTITVDGTNLLIKEQ